jgi:hypothetical protein
MVISIARKVSMRRVFYSLLILAILIMVSSRLFSIYSSIVSNKSYKVFHNHSIAALCYITLYNVRFLTSSLNRLLPDLWLSSTCFTMVKRYLIAINISVLAFLLWKFSWKYSLRYLVVNWDISIGSEPRRIIIASLIL